MTLPSPLLSAADMPPEVLLHFQITPGGKFTSPRVLNGMPRARAIPSLLTEAEMEAAGKRLGEIKKLIDPPKLLAQLRTAGSTP